MDKQEHPYALLLRAIADGKQIQSNVSENIWRDLDTHLLLVSLVHDDLLPPSMYRVKPTMIVINGIEVPAPEAKPPEHHTKYWIPYLHLSPYNIWVADREDVRNLLNGLVHLSESNAEHYTKALLSKDEALIRQMLEALECTGEPDDPGHRCSHCDDYVDRNSVLRNAARKWLEERPDINL